MRWAIAGLLTFILVAMIAVNTVIPTGPTSGWSGSEAQHIFADSIMIAYAASFMVSFVLKSYKLLDLIAFCAICSMIVCFILLMIVVAATTALWAGWVLVWTLVLSFFVALVSSWAAAWRYR
jgi:hypothetical protein